MPGSPAPAVHRERHAAPNTRSANASSLRRNRCQLCATLRGIRHLLSSSAGSGRPPRTMQENWGTILLTITTTSESVNFECHDREFAKRPGVERPYPAPSRFHQSLFVREADRAKKPPGRQEYVVHRSRCPVSAECTRRRAVSLSPYPPVQVDNYSGDDRRVRRLTEFSESVLPPARHFCIRPLPALGRRQRERVRGVAEPNEARAIPIENLQFVTSVRV